MALIECGRTSRREALFAAGATLLGAALPVSPALAQPSLGQPSIRPLRIAEQIGPAQGAATADFLTLSSDGRSALSNAKFGAGAMLWDLASKGTPKRLPAEVLLGSVLSSNGTRAVLLDSKGVLHVWDLTGEPRIVRTIATSLNSPDAIALTPDGRYAQWARTVRNPCGTSRAARHWAAAPIARWAR